MIVLRFLSHVFLLIAFAEVVMGLCIWLTGHDVMRSAGEIWYELRPGSLNLAQAIVQRYLHPDLWQGLVVPLLLRPFWESVVINLIALLVLAGSIAFLDRLWRRLGKKTSVPDTN